MSLYIEKETLNTRLTESQNASSEMVLQFQHMRDELNAAKHEIDVLRKQNQHLTGVNTIRTEELFGRSTEKAADIFERASGGNAANEDPVDEDAGKDTEGGSEGNRFRGSSRGKGGGRGGSHGGRKHAGKRAQDLSKLPSCTIFDYDVDALNEEYGEGNWRFAYWNETVKVELVKQQTYVKRTFTPVISVGLEHELVRKGNHNAFMPKSLVSESLLAQLMLDKFRMFQPLYRLEHDEMRYGFPLSRQTMSNWVCRACHELLLPVYEYMCDGMYQQCDETTYIVINDGRPAGSKSFIWAHRTSEMCQSS